MTSVKFEENNNNLLIIEQRIKNQIEHICNEEFRISISEKSSTDINIFTTPNKANKIINPISIKDEMSSLIKELEKEFNYNLKLFVTSRNEVLTYNKFKNLIKNNGVK